MTETIINFAVKSTLYMTKRKDYSKDISEIRSMMERSSKFLALSGWAGIMAGIIALAGSYYAVYIIGFNPGEVSPHLPEGTLYNITVTAFLVFMLALSASVMFSRGRAKRKGEKIWNAASKQLLIQMAVPLVTGGILITISILKGLIGLAAPISLIFYGLSLFNAGKHTVSEVQYLGFVQILFGLAGVTFIHLGMIFWAGGFGAAHIAYGLYMYIRYER